MSFALRGVVLVVVWLLAAWFSYAFAAGYIGGELSAPVGLVLAAAIVGAAAVTTHALMRHRA
jgi:hypothetical protein